MIKIKRISDPKGNGALMEVTSKLTQVNVTTSPETGDLFEIRNILLANSERMVVKMEDHISVTISDKSSISTMITHRKTGIDDPEAREVGPQELLTELMALENINERKLVIIAPNSKYDYSLLLGPTSTWEEVVKAANVVELNFTGSDKLGETFVLLETDSDELITCPLKGLSEYLAKVYLKYPTYLSLTVTPLIKVSLSTPMGWMDTFKGKIALPYDVDISDRNQEIYNLFDRFAIVPFENRSDLEELTEYGQVTWNRVSALVRENNDFSISELKYGAGVFDINVELLLSNPDDLKTVPELKQ